MSKKEGKLSKKTIAEIKEVRTRIRKGECYTEKEVEKRYLKSFHN